MTVTQRERLYGGMLGLITAGVIGILSMNLSLMRTVDRLEERMGNQIERLNRIENRLDGAK